MNLMRLAYIVPVNVIDKTTGSSTLRRKAVFEAIQTNADGNPVRAPQGGSVPQLAADGKPLRAGLLLGNWRDGTGLLSAELHRGGKVTTIENFVMSVPGDVKETVLDDGTKSQVAKTVAGYHVYVRAELAQATKDGKPVLGQDGRVVWNVEDPTWVLYTSATGTFAVPAPKSAPVATTAAEVSEVAA